MNMLTGLSNVFPVILVLILASPSYAQVGTDTVTISEAPEFQNQRCRGQQCLTELPSIVGCQSPYPNACFCTDYVRNDAIKALSSCAYATDYFACPTPLKEVEYTAVVSIYNRYCSPSAAAITTTEDSSKPSVTVDRTNKPAPVAPTVFVTVTPSSNGGTPVAVTRESLFILLVLSVTFSIGVAVHPNSMSTCC